MKFFSLFIFVSCVSLALSAQPEQVAIMEPINNLFDGMNKGDSAMIHRAFTHDATFVTIGKDKEGNPRFRRSQLQPFLVAMASPRAEVYSEPIWDVKIDIDGNMAQVWARYAFYVDKNFHHCGVDAFQLFKASEGWKIFQLADTRQEEGCKIPSAIQERFK